MIESASVKANDDLSTVRREGNPINRQLMNLVIDRGLVNGTVVRLERQFGSNEEQLELNNKLKGVDKNLFSKLNEVIKMNKN